MKKPSAHDIHLLLGNIVFGSRWILYPTSLALISALLVYVGSFIVEDVHFIGSVLFGATEVDHESLMVMLLGLVDGAMVANLIVLIVLSSYQLFIRKFDIERGIVPQFLDQMDTGIQKVKVSLSISLITLVQLLKDFVHIDTLDWNVVTHRVFLHLVAVVSTIAMALIWRIMHPAHMAKTHADDATPAHGEHS